MRVATFRRWALLALLVGSWGEAVAAPTGVVVFELDARQISNDEANRATQAVLRSIENARDLRLISPAQVEAQLGVGPAERARACDYDVFCLVEVGELVGAERVLSGHLRIKDSDPEHIELKLVAVDVVRATITDLVRWQIPKDAGRTLEDAAQAAARRLLLPPDAVWPLVLFPENARLDLYGELLEPKDVSQGFWSGRYRVRVVAPGHAPEEREVRLRPGRNPPLEVGLMVDPNYEAKRQDDKVFDRRSRRLGSRAQADSVGALLPAGELPTPAYQKPWPYVAAGAGLASAGVGLVLMNRAQGDYNRVAALPRYAGGAGLGVFAARETRDEAESQYRVGSALTWTGVGVVGAAALWILIDLAMGDDEP